MKKYLLKCVHNLIWSYIFRQIAHFSSHYSAILYSICEEGNISLTWVHLSMPYYIVKWYISIVTPGNYSQSTFLLLKKIITIFLLWQSNRFFSWNIFPYQGLEFNNIFSHIHPKKCSKGVSSDNNIFIGFGD